MRAAAAATDKYVLDFCLPGRILRMGGNVVPYAVPRTVLSRISRYRRRSFVGSTSSPLRVHPPPILRAKFWIIFFFAEIRHPRDGYFPMEVERTRYREEVW